MSIKRTLSEAQAKLWLKSQYQQANRYMANKGIVVNKVVVEKSRYLVPNLAIWLLKDKHEKKYWVINGVLSGDHAQAETAKNAKEVTRHFSMKWHLQAEKLLASEDENQKKWGKELVNHAENLSQLYKNTTIWS